MPRIIPEARYFSMPSTDVGAEVLRNLIVDHEIGVLEVHALAGGIGCDQHAHLRIGAEQRLELAALVAVRAAMNADDGIVIAEHTGDLAVQVVQRIAMLREN